MSVKSVVELRKELKSSMGRVSKMDKETVLKHLAHFKPAEVAIAAQEKKSPASVPLVILAPKKALMSKVIPAEAPKTPKAKLVKGSPEMKAHMDKLRSLRKKKAAAS